MLVGFATFLVWRAIRGRSAPGELGFFYDESAQKIFTGPRTAPPPIRGVDGPEEDGYRALVISTRGDPSDRSSWQVAYLEKFSPELKEKVTAAQTAEEALSMGRGETQGHRFIRRVGESEWVPMNSPAAEAILSGWINQGEDGKTPVVCTP